MYDLPKPGDLIGRKYQIVKRIGAGGMGIVYEAMNVDTEGRVALKWLSPELSHNAEATERFKREAKLTARIHHPNVVAVHDCGEHEGQLYLVMELLRGHSLREQLRKEPMAIEAICRILLPVLRGVSAAHAAGVLHRDLKPENIFLCDSPDGLDPLPKVLDFGIAKLGYEGAETALSAQSSILGTYQYMAPEQLRRQPDLDARVDVYAMGVVLYRMLTGELPYIAENPVDLALQILQSEAPRVSERVSSAPPELDDVVARALARDRSHRFASMHELAMALEPFAGGLRYRGASSAGEPPSSKRAQALETPFVATAAPAPKSRARLWSAAALAVAGAGALLAWRYSGASDASPVAEAPAAREPLKGSDATTKQPVGAGDTTVPLAAPAGTDDWATVPAQAPDAQPTAEVTEPDAGPRTARRERRDKKTAPSKPAPAAEKSGGSWDGRGPRVTRDEF